MALFDHLVAREVGNGIWFIITFEILLFGCLYMFGKVWSAITGRTCIIFRSTMPEKHPWWLPRFVDYPMQVASGLLFYMAGEAMRGGWVWWYMHCVNTSQFCSIAEFVWPLWLGIALGVVGGLCLIRLINPPQWRNWSVPTCAVVAIGVPIILYLAA